MLSTFSNDDWHLYTLFGDILHSVFDLLKIMSCSFLKIHLPDTPCIFLMMSFEEQTIIAYPLSFPLPFYFVCAGFFTWEEIPPCLESHLTS